MRRDEMTKQGNGIINVPELRRAATKVVALALDTKIGPSRGAFGDPFESMSISGIIPPPINPQYYCQMARMSNVLPQLFKALEVGIESYGHSYECFLKTEEEKKLAWDLVKDEKDVEGKKTITAENIDELLDQEKERLEWVFDYFNPFESFVDIRKKDRADKETIGWWTMEIQRDDVRRISGGGHLPAYQMRLMKMDEDPIYVKIKKLNRKWQWSEVEQAVYFRRFVQVIGNTKRYFKQFGDPRDYSWKTGKPISHPTPENEATEVIYCGNYVAGTPYGMPDWSGQMANVGGS